MLAGTVAGMLYWTSCYPMDVIKNRIMAAPDVAPPTYRGVVDCARSIYRDAGLRGFFKGWVPCMARAAPANAATFVVYEAALAYLP